MDQKVKQHRFLKYLWLLQFTHTKKVDTESFSNARIRIRMRNTGFMYCTRKDTTVNQFFPRIWHGT
jgi:hypothetical protein